jgi:hypothetical protein
MGRSEGLVASVVVCTEEIAPTKTVKQEWRTKYEPFTTWKASSVSAERFSVHGNFTSCVPQIGRLVVDCCGLYRGQNSQNSPRVNVKCEHSSVERLIVHFLLE